MALQLHQERVVIEKDQLDERLEKLLAFRRSERFQEVPVAEQLRLDRQLHIMRKYSAVLDERIAAFNQ